MTFALIFQCIPFQFMNELEKFIGKMIEYFNSVEEKLVCFFIVFCMCFIIFYLFWTWNMIHQWIEWVYPSVI